MIGLRGVGASYGLSSDSATSLTEEKRGMTTCDTGTLTIRSTEDLLLET